MDETTELTNTNESSEQEENKYVTLSARMGLNEKLEVKKFKVTGPEYAQTYAILVPEDTDRKKANSIVTNWVNKNFPYSRNYSDRKILATDTFDNYNNLPDLIRAVKSGEIDGVNCKNSATILYGLVTKGQGEGGGYHLIDFPPTDTTPGHGVVYDYRTKEYLDPQTGVTTLDGLRKSYPHIVIDENTMKVVVPGRERSQMMVAATGEVISKQRSSS